MKKVSFFIGWPSYKVENDNTCNMYKVEDDNNMYKVENDNSMYMVENDN